MDKLLSFLGLCKRAGKLETGEESVGAAVRRDEARLILTASDAAVNTQKRAMNFSNWSGTEAVTLSYTKDELGDMLGKRVCAVIAITDAGMATSFAEKLARENKEYEELYKRMLDRQKKRGKKSGNTSSKGGM